MMKLSKAKTSAFFEAISAKMALYIPTDDDKTQSSYKIYHPGMVLSTQLNTTRSAKDLFFPQVEHMVNFKFDGRTIQIDQAAAPGKPFAVFGVRPCDAKSFKLLDKVFYHCDQPDTFYVSRRDSGLIITLACNQPEESCLCTAFGINPAEPSGDINCWEDNENFYIEAETRKGKDLLAEAEIAALLEEGGEAEAKSVKENIAAIAEKLPFGKLNFSHVGAGKTQELWDNPAWAKLSESCLGCGTCTFVCPTCQCFDIRDFNGGKTIQRYRCWDSCMYSDFTETTTGNPRASQKERMRQRFMHKLVYYPDMHEEFGCVGCGRCLRSCPINMNIVKAVKALEGK